MSNFITFSLNKQVMGVPVECVEKIMNKPQITKVPSSINYIEGVISYQGEIIPALNLKKLLKMEDTINEDAQIIIIHYNERKAAIIVDEVSEIENVEGEVPYLKAKSQYITGTMRLKDNMVNIINPEVVNFADER
ncbi:MAG: chemotaxis protein CheW [Solirubrobacterales bacterium]